MASGECPVARLRNKRGISTSTTTHCWSPRFRSVPSGFSTSGAATDSLPPAWLSEYRTSPHLTSTRPSCNARRPGHRADLVGTRRHHEGRGPQFRCLRCCRLQRRPASRRRHSSGIGTARRAGESGRDAGRDHIRQTLTPKRLVALDKLGGLRRRQSDKGQMGAHRSNQVAATGNSATAR